MTFEEWLDEIEVYGSRRERFFEDLLAVESPYVPTPDMIKWLRAAYNVGYTQGVEIEEHRPLKDAGQPWLRTYDGKLE